MDKIEMMVGYDINFYEKKFNDNSQKVATCLYNFLKKTIGNKVWNIDRLKFITGVVILFFKYNRRKT